VWTGLRVDGKNHHFVFVGMFTLDGLYGQPNSGVGGNLQRKRRMTNPFRDFNATKLRRAAKVLRESTRFRHRQAAG
jgi:hypothetical protein